MKRTIIISIIAIIFCSCEGYLSVKPIGKLIPTKIYEYENLLNNTGLLNHGSFAGPTFQMLGNNFVISKFRQENEYTSIGYNAIATYATYTFKVPYIDPNIIDPSPYAEHYRNINIYNTVINGITELEGGDLSKQGKEIIAQAKAARAWQYMTLALQFGPAYIKGGDNSTKILPYRTTEFVTEKNPELSSVEQIWSYIKQDLQEAIDAPVNVTNPSRVNKATVYALLCQHAMYTSDWGKMLEYAEEAWKLASADKGAISNMIYNFNNFKYLPNPSAKVPAGVSIESVLSLSGEDGFITQVKNRESLLARSLNNFTQTHRLSDEYISLFDKNNDLRYKLFMLNIQGYAKGKLNEGIIKTDFRKSNGKIYCPVGVTYPLLLLMKAEANARNNNLSVALSDLNALRKFRYSGASTNLIDGDNLTQNELIYEILKERRREMSAYNPMVVFDLKRFSQETGKPWCVTNIKHTIGDKIYSADIKSDKFVFPIPNSVIEFNPHWGLKLQSNEYNPLN